MNQSLRDLAYITGSNPNLTSGQRIVFVSDLQRAEAALASKDLQARKEALEKIAEVNLQISLLQAQRALNSGFIAEQANRNLKAAEGTIKLIKDQIRDRDLGKSFDEIAKKVFWEQVAITGTHYLKSVEKILGSWISANKVEENVAKGLKEIVQKSQQEYVSVEKKKLEDEKAELIKLGNEKYYAEPFPGKPKITFTYGNPNEDPLVVMLDERLYKLNHVFDETILNHSQRAKSHVDSLNDELERAKQLSDQKAKKNIINNYWNKLTSDLEEAYNKIRKWDHVWRDQKYAGMDQHKEGSLPPEPYYTKDYDKYIKPNCLSSPGYGQKSALKFVGIGVK
jgi:hypothetical protein